MNRRRLLPPTDHTEDDLRAWAAVTYRAAQRSTRLAGYLSASALHQDRRDAVLMSWLSDFGQRHYARLPSVPKAGQLPVVHLWLRIDPEWPAGRRLTDLP